MKEIPEMISNEDAKRIAASEDTGDGCENCRFYEEDPVTGDGYCRLHDLRTVVIALCGQWERKEDCGEA